MNELVLFVGSFLSKDRGTKGISEKIIVSSLQNEFDFILASTKINPIFRLWDMIVKTLLFSGNLIHIDVYSGKAFIYADIISMLAYVRNKKIIMTIRGGALPEFTESRKSKIKRVLSRANTLQSPSMYLIEYFRTIGISVEYLPNPVNLEHFPYSREQVNPYSLLWVRAFTSIYNPEIPVNVLYELIKDFPDATLTMVGPDKGLLNKVKALTKDLCLEHKVNFAGPVPNEELYKYYQTHHVFLNTTTYESFGVSVAEAASCGIPIVSNPVGEIPIQWKNEVEILYADNNDIDSYLTQIKRIFASEDIAAKLSRNALKNTHQFDWNHIKPIWKNILRDEKPV